MKGLAVCALALAACAGDDGMTGDDGTDTDAAGCVTSDTDPAWLADYLDETMTGLASAPRFTTGQRETTRLYLEGELVRWGWTAERQMFPGGANVFATIPATDGATAGELIIGAHFDTVNGAPGASDNASGCAVVLALARSLSEDTCRSAPVTVVFFDLEESGLTGARAFALLRDPSAVAGVSTIDQVAWDSDGDRVFELESPTSVPTLEAAWRDAARDLGTRALIVSTEGTDHEAFRDEGFAAVGLTEEYVGGDTSPFRHTPQDTLDTVDVEYLQLAARLTLTAVAAQL